MKNKLLKILSVFISTVLIVATIPLSTLPASADYYENKYYYVVNNGEATITGANRSLTLRGDITIPSKLGGYPVTKIGDGYYQVFQDIEKITGITIPSTVKEISRRAFSLCENLKTVTFLGNKLERIGEIAFYGCDSLTSVTIPDSVVTLDYYAFAFCNNLKSITIGKSLKSIDLSFMGSKSLKTINVSEENAIFHSNGNCLIETSTNTLILGSETSVIPNYVSTINSYAFYGRVGLEEISIPNGVKTIGHQAFWDVGLTSINLPESVVTLGDSVFCNFDGGFQSITVDSRNQIYHSKDNCLIYNYNNQLILGCNNSIIPNYVTSIKCSAFYHSNIESIYIPKSINNIGKDAFYGSKISNVYYSGSAEDFKNITIESGNERFEDATWHYNTCELENHIYPSAICSTECENCDWIRKNSNPHTFDGQLSLKCSECGADHYEKWGISGDCTWIVDGTEVVVFGDGIFNGGAYKSEKITRVTIKNGVENIPNYAFNGCSNLVEITIPASVVSIGYTAFYGCDSLSVVGYSGTELQKNNISISEENNALEKCLWLINSCEEHSYRSSCDATCENCFWIRQNTNHEYDDGLKCGQCDFVGLANDYLNVYANSLIRNTDNFEVESFNVTYKNNKLVFGTDYTLFFKDFDKYRELTIFGRGDYEGIEKTVKFNFNAADLSSAKITVEDCMFTGKPVTPKVTVTLDGITLSKGVDYNVTYYNNTSVGDDTASVIITGIGNYYGYAQEKFSVTEFEVSKTDASVKYSGNSSVTIEGGYLELRFTECLKSYEVTTSSGAYVSSRSYNAPGGNCPKIYFPKTGTYYVTYYTQGYDYVYVAASGTVRYSWVGYEKVNTVTVYYKEAASTPKTTSPTKISQGFKEIDYKTMLLNVSDINSNANLDGIAWSVSNEDVATIGDNGILNLKTAGKTIITAEIGDLQADLELNIEPLSISKKAKILSYNAEENTCVIEYEGQILRENIDYKVESEIKGDATVVTVKGLNLFGGELVGLYYANSENIYCSDNISMSSLPSKLEYTVNTDDLDLSGAVVKVDLNGEEIEFEVTDDMISGFDKTKPGKQEIVVNLFSAKTTFDVNVFCKTHTYNQYKEKDDLNHTSKCSVCEYVDTKAHSWEKATCTKAKKCSVCGAINGTALGHTYKTTTTKATLTKDGRVVNKCVACDDIRSKTTIYCPEIIKLSSTNYTYNGKQITPAIEIINSNNEPLNKQTDYVVNYGSGRKNVGKYKVTINFKGNYSGTKTLYFTINPTKTTVKSLKAGKNSLNVKINKKSSQVTGYQVQYATNKNFKSAKSKNLTNYRTTSVTLTRLSSKKTYYVRVRTYKIVSGVKYYSDWSNPKYKKTK